MSTTTPIQRIRAALDAHLTPCSPISKADCLAQIECIVAEVERLDSLVSIDDQVKTGILRASILNIGRLLPDNMSIAFTRGANVTGMKLVFPDGEEQSQIFAGYTPIYGVPVVPALFNLDAPIPQ